MEQSAFEIDDMPYQLRIENVSGYMEDCYFCGSSTCRRNCALPYDSNQTVLDILQKLDVTDNVSFYNEGRGRKDVTIAFRWASQFDAGIQRVLSSQTMPPIREGVNTEVQEKKDVTIDDCFNEFKKSEILDEQNKWYCNKCKDHVQATKILEIYKAPPIFVINLKRFKYDNRR